MDLSDEDVDDWPKDNVVVVRFEDADVVVCCEEAGVVVGFEEADDVVRFEDTDWLRESTTSW